METLTRQSHKLAEELYKQQARPSPADASAGAGSEHRRRPGADGGHDAGDVVDAEYTVKN